MVLVDEKESCLKETNRSPGDATWESEKSDDATHRSISNSQSVPELSSLVNRSRSLSVDVRREASRERESFDELLQALLVSTVLRVELGDGSFEVESSEDGGSSVTRTGDEDEAARGDKVRGGRRSG